ncbi:hypothetical protein BJX63DRAFT_379821 [Aspergillus granulosus]|uniref:GPI anchored protein n=1 Tax=Aspergillus granulosus TaxID=176169 RepID=A0ABR4HYS3_9EURO
MHSTTILLASAAITGAVAVNQVVTLNLPTDVANSSFYTAAELIGSSGSATSYSFLCSETATICETDVTLVVEPTAYTMMFALSEGLTYTGACDVDTSASTDSCSVRTGTDDTWEDIGTDDISATEITITATAAPASNSASATTPASTTTTMAMATNTASTTGAETADASASSFGVETTDSDDAAMAMMTAVPWAGAVVAGLAAAVAMV